MSLLLRINAVTGWKLPDTKELLNALKYEFDKYLDEKCSDLKPDEIAYSVRTYGLTIKEWGKNLNIALIDQCISEYRSKRYDASQEEERVSIDQKQAKIDTSLPDSIDWSDYWDKLIKSAKNGQIRNEFISNVFYDWMIKTTSLGFAPTPKEIKETFREAAGIYKSEVQAALATGGYAGADPLPEVKRRLDILNRDEYQEILNDRQLRTALTQIAKSLLVKRFAVQQVKQNT